MKARKNGTPSGFRLWLREFLRAALSALTSVTMCTALPPGLLASREVPQLFLRIPFPAQALGN